MFFDHLVSVIKTIALENPQGFTVHLASREVITSGIVVAHLETQNCFGRGGLETAIEHALYNYGHVGGWRNPNGEMQYDSVRVFTDLKKAIKWGRKQKQYAIFDIDNGWEIIL